jgi:aerobic C4-dicarboxylate transport protein
VVVNVIRPGSGFNVDPRTLDAKAVDAYAKTAAAQSTADFILHIIPKTFIDALRDRATCCRCCSSRCFSATRCRTSGQRTGGSQLSSRSAPHFFRMMNTIMKLAPLGAGGAMAFTIGNYGLGR